MKRILMIQPDAFTRRVLARLMALSIEDAGGDSAGGGATDGGAGDTAGGTTERDLTDRDDRLDAAMEFFSKGDGEGDEKQPGGNLGSGEAEGGNQGAGEQGKDQQAGDEHGQVSEEALKADPRYQELDTFRSEVQPLMERYGIPDAKEMDAQLQDAQILYAIAQGTDVNGQPATASRLMDTFTQVWPKETIDRVAGDLANWLSAKGYLQGGAAAGRKEGGEQAGFKDPLETRVETMEREREQARQAEQSRQATERVEKVRGEVKSAVAKFADTNKVAKEDVDMYMREALSLIPDNQRSAAWARFEKGNLVDLQKALSQVHNREVARLKRQSQQQVTDATRRAQGAPRIPAGGAPPAPAGQQKRDLRSRDGRLAAAQAEWDK